MLRTIIAATLALGLATAPALAAGGTSETTTTTTAVPAAPAMTDEWAAKLGDLGPAYLDTVKLMEAGKYEEGLKALDALAKPDDPRVLNWKGYATRKMGKPKDALAFYDKAIAAAPDFTPAYEYRGEAHLMLKDMEKAKADLAMVEKLCGSKTCEEYVELSAAVEKASGGGGLWNWLFN